MSDTPNVEERVSNEELTRRAWIALGVSEVVYSAATVLGGLGAVAVTDERAQDGWAQLSLVASVLVVAIPSVLVAIPVAVHTVGRRTVRATEGWPSWRAGLAHLAVGLMFGALVGGVMAGFGSVSLPAAILAFVLPPGLAGWAANSVVPYAARHRWVVVVSWALAAVPILAILFFILKNFWWGVTG